MSNFTKFFDSWLQSTLLFDDSPYTSTTSISPFSCSISRCTIWQIGIVSSGILLCVDIRHLTTLGIRHVDWWIHSVFFVHPRSSKCGSPKVSTMNLAQPSCSASASDELVCQLSLRYCCDDAIAFSRFCLMLHSRAMSCVFCVWCVVLSLALCVCVCVCLWVLLNLQGLG